MGGIRQQAHGALGQAHLAQARPQCLHNGVAAGPRIAAAAQHTGTARLDGQGGGIAGDVGAALVDDGNDAHRHGGLFNHKAVGAHDPAQHRAHRVGQGGNLADALGHIGQAAGGQGQTVQHHIADAPAGVLHVLPVGLQNLVLRRNQRHGHGLQRGILGVGIGQRQRHFCALRGVQHFLCGHWGQTSFMRHCLMLSGPQSGCQRTCPRQCRTAPPHGSRS